MSRRHAHDQTDCTLLRVCTRWPRSPRRSMNTRCPSTPSAAACRTLSGPTATAVADGRWSAPATWSTHAVPSAGAKVLIPAGRQVAYDVETADTMQCVEIRGRLAFDTERPTRLTVVTLIVMEDGQLEVGTEERPVAATARAEIQIADRPFDLQLDPGRSGTASSGWARSGCTARSRRRRSRG